MKKSELKEIIKELYLQEYSLNEDDTPENSEEESLDDESFEDEDTPLEDEEEVGGDEKKQIQNALTDALEASKIMGDDTLSTQIGNTITYFTREHILNQ